MTDDFSVFFLLPRECGFNCVTIRGSTSGRNYYINICINKTLYVVNQNISVCCPHSLFLFLFLSSNVIKKKKEKTTSCRFVCIFTPSVWVLTVSSESIKKILQPDQ
ncbi:hypothetical protein ATANTOWER_005584 [Ataeniobius toweri]|uniref:Uncharacterized protein n=1 Tax=Ataeniobius toweri TaxID=208326 RepID=A0ABU7AFJ5_9TELE|nr:hypothetical protein [Ataeniobius toweri]